MPLQNARPRWPLVSLRVTAAIVALLALGQPFLAGGFLQGFYPLLNAHMIAAMILSTAVVLAVVAALLVWRVGGGPSKFAVQYLVLLVLCVAQITLGFSRVLILHIPLGVGVFVMAEKLITDVMRYKPGADAATAEKAENAEKAETAETAEAEA